MAGRNQRDAAMTRAAEQPGAVLEHPFGDHSGVWKVGSKIFCMVGLLGDTGHMSVKADPADVQALREQHEAITKAPYLSAVHWILVPLDSSVPTDMVLELVEDSYDVVRASLTKKAQLALSPAGSPPPRSCS